jgi:hypothetical protein
MMNTCGYYSCKNGIRKCGNPAKSNTDLRKLGTDYCDWCKRYSGGIYPSQLQRVDFTELPYEVIDKSGKVLS